MDRVAQQFQQLLQLNTNASCFQFTQHVLAALQAEGYQGWGHVGKTAGEGQYTPPGWVPHQVGGFQLTGVSHDAIFHLGMYLQVDLLGGGNDGPTPLGQPASAQWNEIPSEFYRVNNPWVAPIPFGTVTPPTNTSIKLLPKGEALTFLKALDAFYRAPDGLQRPEGIGGDMEAVAQWFYQGVIEGKSIEDVKAQIRTSDEWKGKHP